MKTEMNFQRISVDKLKPAKYNPRKDLKPGDLAYSGTHRSAAAIPPTSPHALLHLFPFVFLLLCLEIFEISQDIISFVGFFWVGGGLLGGYLIHGVAQQSFRRKRHG